LYGKPDYHNKNRNHDNQHQCKSTIDKECFFASDRSFRLKDNHPAATGQEKCSCKQAAYLEQGVRIIFLHDTFRHVIASQYFPARRKIIAFALRFEGGSLASSSLDSSLMPHVFCHTNVSI